MPVQILWYKINYMISTIRLAPWYISRVSTEEYEPQVLIVGPHIVPGLECELSMLGIIDILATECP